MWQAKRTCRALTSITSVRDAAAWGSQRTARVASTRRTQLHAAACVFADQAQRPHHLHPHQAQDASTLHTAGCAGLGLLLVHAMGTRLHSFGGTAARLAHLLRQAVSSRGLRTVLITITTGRAAAALGWQRTGNFAETDYNVWSNICR